MTILFSYSLDRIFLKANESQGFYLVIRETTERIYDTSGHIRYSIVHYLINELIN